MKLLTHTARLLAACGLSASAWLAGNAVLPGHAQVVGDPLGLVEVGTAPGDNTSASVLSVSNGGNAGASLVPHGFCTGEVNVCLSGVAVATNGNATSAVGVAVSGNGCAYGIVAVSLSGCDQVGQQTTGGIAVSVDGQATGSVLAVSVFGDAKACNGLEPVAVAVAGGSTTCTGKLPPTP